MTRAVPEALQDRLDAGATGLCRCWKIERKDGQALRFTDHDVPLALDGATYSPTNGFSASAIEAASGLAPDNLEIVGVLTSGAISEADLTLGLYDGASVTMWLVDWRDPALRLLQFQGHLGAITRRGEGFSAELLGLSHRLNRPEGRVFSPECDATLGDDRCGISLDDARHARDFSVRMTEDRHQFLASGLDSFATDFFRAGHVLWKSGKNARARAPVVFHEKSGEVVRVTLGEWPVFPIAPGDRGRIFAGCDKRFATCREKFRNQMNFRGFPHMPGDDWALSYPGHGESNDGTSLIGK